MKKLLFCVVSSLTFVAYSQNENDLYRFSRTTFQGDARFEAMAGSFGALGANQGSSQINPAGFGRYSSSQFGMAMGLTNVKNESEFYGTTTSDSKASFKLSNLGFVFVNDKSDEQTGFIYSQVGIGYNRIENFNYNTKYEGVLFNSLLDGFTSAGDGITPEFLAQSRPFSTHLAYESFLIDWDINSNSYYSQLTDGDMFHEREIENKGGINEWYFSYSANYLNKLYLGANIGIRNFNYTERYLHKETLMDTVGTDLRSFDYSYNLRTKGTGINIKIGMIYLPTDNVRFGLAIHSPTFVEMNDTWSADMNGYFTDATYSVVPELKPSAEYIYKIRTPTRVIGSFAYVFGTYGCFNADVEYVDYRSAFFRGSTTDGNEFYDFKYENEIAKEVFRPALNIRLGGEVVLANVFFVRGGYALYPPSFKDNVQAEVGSQNIYTAGFGYKNSNFVIDLAYKINRYTRNYRAFAESLTTIKSTASTFVISASLLF